MNRAIRLAAGTIVFTALSYASTIYTYDFVGTAGGDSENANAVFKISNCNVSGCQLDIILTNNVASIHDAGFAIIGLSFNIGALTTPGTLLTSGGNALVTNGSGGQVTKVTYSGSTGTTSLTSTAPNWAFVYGNSAAGCQVSGNSFCLNGHANNGSPNDLIIGPGPFTGANASVDNHDPYLSGPVDFEIDNFAGLTANSTFSNVRMDFGTNPDGHLDGCLDSDCGGGTPQSVTPEPFSFLLAGTGLLAVGLFRRFATR